MPAAQRADDLSGGHVEGGEEAGDAVAGVVVGAFLRHAGHHRQHRLGPVECLDLRLLVDAEHDGFVRRVEVETDDVAYLVDELRVGGEFEGFGAVGFELERFPDPSDRGFTEPGLFGHRRPGPMGGVFRGGFQGVGEDLFHLLVGDLPRGTGPGLVDQAVQAMLDEAGSPFAHGRPGHPQPFGHRAVVIAGGAFQDDA